jgi:hypothetical protein
MPEMPEMPLEVKLAIGRLFRMMSRPSQPGDVDMFYKCRSIILNAAEAGGVSVDDYQPNWVRDRLKGAQGD